MQNRVAFLVDGFNVYYSILDAINDLGGISLKWLNLRAFCESYLHLFGPKATSSGVYYFSALKTHRLADDPDIVNRHQTYISALHSTGVNVELARFKRKDILCLHCHKQFEQYEEKETDVAIAAKLFELLIAGTCEKVALVCGDTDIIPAIRTARSIYPQKEICVMFPHRRVSVDLKQAASMAFKLKAKRYAQYQFADPIVLPAGANLQKPASW